MCEKQEDWENQFVEIKHTFGYGTEFDCTSVELDICEECFIKIFKDQI
jgi:hypothetical protein